METHHSKAFFNPLGILKTYLGVQMMMPAAVSIFFRKPTISFGGLSAESSGSKWGRAFQILKNIQVEEVFGTCRDVLHQFFVRGILACTAYYDKDVFLDGHCFSG